MNPTLFVTTETQAVASMEGRICQLAARYASPLCPFDDLCQEGRLGVLEAFRRFDPTRGVKFNTFADFYLLKNLRRYRANTHTLIRVPRWKQECAEGAPEFYINSLSAWDSSECAPLHDKEASAFAEGVLTRLHLLQLVQELPERMRQVLTLRFLHEWSLEEVGAHLGLTRAHVQQVQYRSQEQLRRIVAEEAQ